MKKHKWWYFNKHQAHCKVCGIERRKIWFPGGGGVSAYYSVEGKLISSLAPKCIDKQDKDIGK